MEGGSRRQRRGQRSTSHQTRPAHPDFEDSNERCSNPNRRRHSRSPERRPRDYTDHFPSGHMHSRRRRQEFFERDEPHDHGYSRHSQRGNERECPERRKSHDLDNLHRQPEARHSRRHRRRKRQRSPSHSPSPLPNLAARSGIVSVDYNDSKKNVVDKSSRKQRRVAASRSDSSHDDTTDHYKGDPGSMIGEHYQVIKEVGMGTFGRVLDCLDLRRRDYVAVKVVRAVKRYYESALIEARMVQDINRRGGRGLTHCVRLFDSFTFQGHYCIVFESLGPSLYDFLKQHDYKPFPMIVVQDIAVQLLQALEFLHGFKVIHTDLKMENILLMNNHETLYNNRRVPESTRIKLIDFGGACYDDDKRSSVINTRQYRAPEVILGTGWSMPSDVWSAGCILVELYKGELLFATHDSCEHLGLMDHIIGSFPPSLIRHALTSSKDSIVTKMFDPCGKMRRLETVLSANSASYVRRAETLSSIVRNPSDSWFLELLRRMLVIDPEERATAHESLQYLGRIRRDVVRCV